ncbi:hypothetical protein L596_014682 [Steinernema carpocapsae]|uniref:SWIM-type domain-containing protein n=1 Tax=Steinernema carpocapsae TaxID=34508 RepID=A0A4U5NCT6_STECR|nr:hypothetical protein L596_014682 [Steinernema carpocapsae]
MFIQTGNVCKSHNRRPRLLPVCPSAAPQTDGIPLVHSSLFQATRAVGQKNPQVPPAKTFPVLRSDQRRRSMRECTCVFKDCSHAIKVIFRGEQINAAV